MFHAFAAAVEESAEDGTRVLVITGAGEAFCSGLDLSSLAPADLATLDVAAAVRDIIHPPILRLRSLRAPVVARIHGPAAGVGFSYVLASDIRVASDAPPSRRPSSASASCPTAAARTSSRASSATPKPSS